MSDEIDHELSDTYRALKRFENHADFVGDTIVVKVPAHLGADEKPYVPLVDFRYHGGNAHSNGNGSK